MTVPQRQPAPAEISSSAPSASPEGGPEPWWLYCGGLIVAALFLGMLWWCWGRCPDVLTDFGREVYVPWRLAEGQTLYADLAYFNGPLSPYFNSLLFRAFGPSIACLAAANAMLLAGLLSLLARLITSVSNARVALASCLFFVLVYGFGHLDTNGNFNYIYPYSHEATHGLLLALGAIDCFGTAIKRGSLPWIAAAGLLTGLAALTKPEIIVALFAAIALSAVVMVWHPLSLQRAKLWATFLIAGAVPVLAAWALLAMAMPAGMALRGTLGGLAYLADSELTSQVYYRNLRGTTRLEENLAEICKWLLIYPAVFAPAYFLSLRTSTRAAVTTALVVAALSTGLAWWFFIPVIANGLSALPIFMALAVAWQTWTLFCHRSTDQNEWARASLQLILLVFALSMTAKIVLDLNITVYGFTLSMPGALMLMVVMLGWIPESIRRRGGSGLVFQAAWLGPVAVLCGACLVLDSANLSLKTVPVGRAGDRLLAHPHVGAAVNEVLAKIEQFPPQATLAVVPEGVMINYLARRVNPTPYINFFPPEMIMFGERNMVEAFAAHPPDYLVWVPGNAHVYGFASFGDGYGRDLALWIVGNYEAVEPPTTDGRYHLILMKYVGQH